VSRFAAARHRTFATNNATLQLGADPAKRGRVMSLNAVALLAIRPREDRATRLAPLVAPFRSGTAHG
jgi:hypothetical protein